MAQRLFVYGSLAPGKPNAHLLADIPGKWELASVTGRLIKQGWGAAMGYPGIIVDAQGDAVQGLLFTSEGLDAHWNRLDAFEGEDYRRILVQALLGDGTRVDAYIYVIRDVPPHGPKYPWRIDTNDRYRELVSAVLSLATAALLLPTFLAREILGISSAMPLMSALSCSVYLAWLSLATSILACISYFYFSAKWVRLAWEQPVSIFGMPILTGTVEHALEWSLWIAVVGFLAGIGLTLAFFVGYTS